MKIKKLTDLIQKCNDELAYPEHTKAEKKVIKERKRRYEEQLKKIEK